MPTDKQQLADHLLMGRLDHLVDACRAQGMGWEAIAKELWRLSSHRVNVSGQTLRNWYPEQQSA